MKSIIDSSALFIGLGAQKHPTVISIAGAGGKTSLLFWLAELFQTSDRHVLITTTTRMFMPMSHWPMAFCRDPVMLPRASSILPISFCFHCWKANQRKVQRFAPGAIDVLVQQPEYDVILIEADGSHRMPLRTPGEHEPCIPKSSYCMIAVMGGHISGTKMDTGNVHRQSQFADITGSTPDVPLQLSDLIVLVRHPQGVFKNVPQGYRRVWFINRFSQCENAAA